MSKNKEIHSELVEDAPQSEKTGFFFPEYGVTIFADSRDEALRLLDDQINKT